MPTSPKYLLRNRARKVSEALTPRPSATLLLWYKLREVAGYNERVIFSLHPAFTIPSNIRHLICAVSVLTNKPKKKNRTISFSTCLILPSTTPTYPSTQTSFCGDSGRSEIRSESLGESFFKKMKSGHLQDNLCLYTRSKRV